MFSGPFDLKVFSLRAGWSDLDRVGDCSNWDQLASFWATGIVPLIFFGIGIGTGQGEAVAAAVSLFEQQLMRPQPKGGPGRVRRLGKELSHNVVRAVNQGGCCEDAAA